MVRAVIPLKDFVNAKQRLSGVLAANERRQLFQCMVEDVLEVVSKHPGIEETIIVSDDPSANLLADRYGAQCWSEKEVILAAPTAADKTGLSAVVTAAAQRLESMGEETIFVIHGDLPLLCSDDIDQLLSVHQRAGSRALTIAPDTIQDGSNCLLATPPCVIDFQYGKGSFAKHADAARQASAVFNCIELDRAGIDIDRPDDIVNLLKMRSEHRRTMSYLMDSGVGERVQAMLSDKSVSAMPENVQAIIRNSLAGVLPSETESLALASIATDDDTIADLMVAASELRDRGFRNVVSYSRKVFIPLTHLCRDVCHYCTFAQTPKKIASPYMSVEDVIAAVKEGAEQGCKEALFTLGEKPELRYSAARTALAEMGFSSTLEYAAHVAREVLKETGVLPHINAGCMTAEEFAMLRPVSASMGIMLESASSRLCEKGMPHYGSPDKDPSARLETIHQAGLAKVPFTSGILIGIGETRQERIESLLALRKTHQDHGHLQEIIIQNFRAKENTKMALAPEPDLNELLWTIAVARIIFGSEMSIQAPPNLSPGVLPKIINAGINDWGGVSPVTPDYVNPEAPWPHLEKLAKETATTGKLLQERLTIYPRYARQAEQWLDETLHTRIQRMVDTEGFPRTDNWSPGESELPPTDILQQVSSSEKNRPFISADIKAIIAKVFEQHALSEDDIVRLFQARGHDLAYVCEKADELRQQCVGDTVTYVVNRNINYTNVCYFKCQFCAFSKGKTSENLRGRPYDLGQSDTGHQEIARRCSEAWQRGATEVCMQGGIHPDYSGETYLEIINTVKSATPEMHIHAFSPLEVWQGAATMNLPVKDYLVKLKQAGLDTLPGTAAEILDDEVRAGLCADKINTEQWLEVMESAHQLGFKTTATIMYGHMEKLEHWARHLLRIRQLQEKTGGFTEFVPLPFVHMEAPMYIKGKARMGPTFREAVLMHAVSRLVLSPLIANIQTSWVKMGEAGMKACLQAGANDLGGTLMNESITRAAGAEHGEEFSVDEMIRLIKSSGRTAQQRSTSYGKVSKERMEAAQSAIPLSDITNTELVKNRKSKRTTLIVNA